MIRKIYLAFYNGIQLTLWSAVLMQLIYVSISYIRHVTETKSVISIPYVTERLYEKAAPCANLAQTLAWAEVLHAALGIAGGGVATAFIQSLGRYVILLYVIQPLTMTHSLLVTPILLATWATGDIVRYAFYLWNSPPRFLLWLRYSLFLVLYPIGLIAEWLIYFFTLKEVDDLRLYAIEMPNSFNFAFDFGIWNRIVLGLYFFVGPYLCMHMLGQRRKKLKVRTE